MTIVRRHLRLFVAAWLVFQVASLSALVPRECCLAHKPVATDGHGKACHEAVPAPDNGKRCSLRGTCDGPMAALFALLSNHGVLTDSIAVAPDLHPGAPPIQIRESLVSRLPSPDPPPPRA
jgi:hypothetical protein